MKEPKQKPPTAMTLKLHFEGLEAKKFKIEKRNRNL